MPTAITHQLLAEEVYESLPAAARAEIFSPPLYYFGAQGPDVCFAYNPAAPADENFGRLLHTRAPLLFFRLLAAAAKGNGVVRSYALGYIAHYAADTVFHPYVYAVMRAFQREGRYFHHAVEHAVDGVLLKELRGEGLFSYRLPRPRKIPAEIYAVYARYACACGREALNEATFRRAVRHYYAANALRTPFYRAVYARRAARLFSEAKQRSLRLIGIFLEEEGEGLRAEDFGRHFLTGEVAEGKNAGPGGKKSAEKNKKAEKTEKNG